MAAVAASLPSFAFAQVTIEDNLSTDVPTYKFWKASGAACLTARTGAATAVGGASSIPGCATVGGTLSGGTSGTLPDDPIKKNGALRLTGNDGFITGSITSTVPFPTNQGVQVTFKTVTYGGNNYNGTGADGIAFFLVDALKGVTSGGSGGSLGYACSNSNSQAEGVAGGYVGVGIDEYGNFSNPGDVGAPVAAPNAAWGGFKSNYIAVRGGGNVRYAALTALNSTYYPNDYGDQGGAVRKTCKAGVLVDFSKNDTDGTKGKPTGTPLLDYPLLAEPQKVNGGNIANQQNVAAPLRGAAVPLTYSLSITQDGLLSVSYSTNGGPVTSLINQQSIITGNGPLPANFLFGFTAGTGGGTNIHEITCFKAAQISVSTNSAGSNVPQTTKVQAGSQLYLSFSHPLNSWGQLTASNLLVDATTGLVSVQATANWDASCVLTGGACASTNVTSTSTAAQGSAKRQILTWATAGVGLTYANLTPDQKTAIGGTTDGTERIDFLRGGRRNELTSATTGLFRKRDGVLGDIVNSSPAWVGRPGASYSKLTNNTDLLTGAKIGEFGSNYVTFANKYLQRNHVVYLGANDGLLHAFSAGAYKSDGATFDTTTNTGKELMAYMPAAVVNTIHSTSTTSLDFSSPHYGHNFFVDASPGTGDVYYSGAWHTWLVGGMGSGGNAGGAVNAPDATATGVIFALDITDPSKFSESNAATLVQGEWSSSTMTCVDNPTCGTNLGSTYGVPLIRRLHDGNYAAIFGNGRNSATGQAGIFIMTIAQASGAVTFRFLPAGAANLTNKNGIDYVDAVDLDNDLVMDYIYAGDSAGNLWRFDLTSSDPSKWAVGSSPLFTTAAGQPISTKVTLAPALVGTGLPRLIVAFGTGRQNPQTLTSAATYATAAQALYGVWDWDMASWNAKNSTQYAKLVAPQTVTVATLQGQSMTTFSGGVGSVSGYRTATSNQVCWVDQKFCPTGNTKFGWVMPMPAATEQIIYNLSIQNNILLVNTTIPAVQQALSCDVVPAAGFTLALSSTTGGAPSTPVFYASDTGVTNPGALVGLGLGGTGGLQVFTVPAPVTQTASGGTVSTVVTQTGGGGGAGVGAHLTPPGIGKRVTWVKLR